MSAYDGHTKGNAFIVLSFVHVSRYARDGRRFGLVNVSWPRCRATLCEHSQKHPESSTACKNTRDI